MPRRNGYAAQGGWANGTSNTSSLPADITLNTRSGNQPTEYVASNSIEFSTGFESGASDTFNAYIDASGGSVSGGSTGEGSGFYRYGFNGQENSTEIKSGGSSYTAEFWEYDSRLGRRWNLDPKPTVGISQFSAFNNNPIFLNDILGDSAAPPIFPRHPVKSASDLSFVPYNAIGLVVNGAQSLANIAGDYLTSFGKNGTTGLINSASADFKNIKQGVSNEVNYHLNTPGGQQWDNAKVFFSNSDNYAKAFEQTTVIASTWQISASEGILKGGSSAIKTGENAYNGVRSASKYLQNQGVPRIYRKQILQSFETETISLKAADNATFGLRFHGGFANQKGRYLFPTFTPYTSRVGLALPQTWNSMSGLSQFQITPGSTYIFGRAASQGGRYSGGSYQMYIHNLNDLIPVK